MVNDPVDLYLFLAEMELNQDVMLKVCTDLMSDLYTAVKMSVLTSKLLNFLSRNRRCWVSLCTESVCWEKDRRLSISVPRYLRAPTCSTACPFSLRGSKRGWGELDVCLPQQHSSSVLEMLSSK